MNRQWELILNDEQLYDVNIHLRLSTQYLLVYSVPSVLYEIRAHLVIKQTNLRSAFFFFCFFSHFLFTSVWQAFVDLLFCNGSNWLYNWTESIFK